jgi:hypothetical protein
MKIKSIKFDKDSFRMEVTTPFKVKYEKEIYTGEISSSRNAFVWDTNHEHIRFFKGETILDTFLLDEIGIAHDNTLTAKFL